MTRDKILDRIKKLLALAGNNNSPEEAALAAARAQALMLEHKVSEAQLSSVDDDESASICEIDVQPDGRKTVSRWTVRLASAVARSLGCQVLFTAASRGRRGKINVIGPQDDVNAVRYLFDYLCGEINRMVRTYSGRGRGWANSYRHGAVTTIDNRLGEQRVRWQAETDSRTTALVRRTDTAIAAYTAQQYPRVCKETIRCGRDVSGYVAGKRDGHTVGLPSNRTGALGAAKPRLAGGS